MSHNGKPSLLLSPNSILANALLRSIDILRPRVLASRPARTEFIVGTQINDAPTWERPWCRPRHSCWPRLPAESPPSTPESGSAP